MRWFVIWLMMAVGAHASPEFWRFEWPQTDFSQTTVENWAEILSGGPPKDGIPAITSPEMGPAASASLPGREPVMVLALEGAAARAYPLRYLTWHEIVNDTVAGIPVAVTFCPLCNSGIVFDRRTPAGVLEFGVSGKLRNSDMVMYDRQTESWWQQAIGTAIVGRLTGTQLTALPAWLDSWDGYRAAYPDGLVMTEPRFARSYGQNPYRNYDSARRPFLYSGDPPPHGIPALARVVRVGDRAWPLERLRKAGRIAQAGVVLDWTAGQASALDSSEIAKGRDVGTVRVQNSAGQDLAHDVMFAFAFHAFWPDGVWMLD